MGSSFGAGKSLDILTQPMQSANSTDTLHLSVELASGKNSLVLANPVMAASGTFSYGVEYAKVFDIQRLGAIVSKTTTLQPKAGSPPGRR